jgi:hypothetical protein
LAAWAHSLPLRSILLSASSSLAWRSRCRTDVQARQAVCSDCERNTT